MSFRRHTNHTSGPNRGPKKLKAYARVPLKLYGWKAVSGILPCELPRDTHMVRFTMLSTNATRYGRQWPAITSWCCGCLTEHHPCSLRCRPMGLGVPPATLEIRDFFGAGQCRGDRNLQNKLMRGGLYGLNDYSYVSPVTLLPQLNN